MDKTNELKQTQRELARILALIRDILDGNASGNLQYLDIRRVELQTRIAELEQSE